MDKTKIDWADSTWNPVTGCLHGCEYCYARGIANRFSGFWSDELQRHLFGDGGLHELYVPKHRHTTGKNRYNPVRSAVAPYPYGFDPTLHLHRLDQPKRWTKPRTIFVCSMADLFGDWVPEEWIQTVFTACEAAPQHRYLFLTKNPLRYRRLEEARALPTGKNFWFGSTVCTNEVDKLFIPDGDCNTFASIEPIMSDFTCQGIPNNTDWVIVGAETGRRKDIVVPEKRWIENLAELCDIAETPIFMKESLRSLMGNDFRQQFPWEVETK